MQGINSLKDQLYTFLTYDRSQMKFLFMKSIFQSQNFLCKGKIVIELINVNNYVHNNGITGTCQTFKE